VTDQFVSLHTHTAYSPLDGASKISDIVAAAVEKGNPGLGILDHGNLNGLIEFYLECQKYGITPVLGQEFYLADDRLLKQNVRRDANSEIDGSDKRYYHLSIWAENNDGYVNLMKLSSDAFLNGHHYKPRTDYSMLEEHSSGIIVGTGCLGGPVLQALLHDDYDKAKMVAARLQDIVGKDNLFVELMNHGLPEQTKTNPMLIRIAKEIGAPIFATQDSHYTHKHEAHTHSVLLCCQTRLVHV
jgi:DNA polymerase-3 subunit alpha